ncbi:MAG TPA: TIGR00282 family metallophosphoesterase [Vicinamibacteria bacterium]|nr:TIGR00282 family metallophosphoesterase [Vicinamibacteria bacterium]
MRLLVAGDVVGKAGRKILRAGLALMRQRDDYDLVVVNVENAAAGFGITPDIAGKFFSLGIDVLTTGNHVWDKKEILAHMDDEPRLLRPVNYPDGCPGNGTYVATTRSGAAVAVVNLQGRVFMPLIDCPFRAIDRELEALRDRTPIVLVDLHAEATSEKMALSWYLDGRVSAVVGTHTHVPTADERILPKGTAYITDLGMCGAYDSVIGIEPATSLPRFLTAMPTKFEPASRNPWMCGVVIDVDDSTGLARSIERFKLTESDVG